MSYTVKDVQGVNLTGEFVVTIEKALLREYTNNGITQTSINLRLKKDNGHTTFDTIYWKDETQSYDQKKMDKISKALRITAGTTFNTISDWLIHIEGKKMVINIKESNDKFDSKGNKKLYISFYKPYDPEEASIEIKDEDLPF